MKNLGVPEPLWQELNNRVWHATNREGLEGIIRDGKINLGDRYQGSFCLWKEYVSLFDFVTEEEAKPHDSWKDWLGGHRNEKRIGLWLELDHETAGAGFINAAELSREWNQELGRTVSQKENEEPFRSLFFTASRPDTKVQYLYPCSRERYLLTATITKFSSATRDLTTNCFI